MNRLVRSLWVCLVLLIGMAWAGALGALEIRSVRAAAAGAYSVVPQAGDQLLIRRNRGSWHPAGYLDWVAWQFFPERGLEFALQRGAQRIPWVLPVDHRSPHALWQIEWQAGRDAPALEATRIRLGQAVWTRDELMQARTELAGVGDAQEQRLVHFLWLAAAAQSELSDLLLNRLEPVVADRLGAQVQLMAIGSEIEHGRLDQARRASEDLLAWLDRHAKGEPLWLHGELLRALMASVSGSHADAVAIADEAVRFAESRYPDSALLARAVWRSAVVRYPTDEMAQGRAAFARAIALQSRWQREDGKLLLMQLGFSSLLSRAGATEEYRAVLEQAEVLAQRIPTCAAWRARVAVSLASLAAQDDDSARWQELLETAFRELESERIENTGLANASASLGQMYFLRGDLRAAERVFERADALNRKLRPHSDSVPRALWYRGMIAFASGDNSAALAFYDQAEREFASFTPNHPTRVSLLASRGELFGHLGQNERARADFERALQLDATLARDCYCGAAVRRDYGVFLASIGDDAEALRQWSEARTALLRFQEYSSEHALLDVLVAETKARNGQLDAAAATLAPALALVEEILPGSLRHAQALAVHGQILQAQGQQPKSRDAFCRAADLLDQTDIAQDGQGLTAARFRARHADIYRACLLARAAERDLAGSFIEFERVRARSLINSLGSALSEHPEASSWRALRQRQNALLQQMTDPDATAPSRAQAAPWRALKDELLAGTQRLRERAPKVAALLAPQFDAMTEMQGDLPQRTAYLAISVGESETLLFWLPATGDARILSRPVGRAHWQQQVQRLRAEILRRDPSRRREYEAIAGALFDDLLGDLRPDLASQTELLIAADGALLTLPFSALWDGQRNAYLIQTHALRMVDSLHVHRALRGRAANRDNPFLIVADAASQGEARQALPGARAEAGVIAARSKSPARVLLGADATEAEVRRVAPRSSQLHFAVHSEVDARQPLRSALLLGSGDGEDGRWSVAEVLESLKVSANLVALSSCDSAVGQELRGEGLVSLTRAFRYAGARQVLASLWPVDDQGTARLMQSFYAVDQSNAALALRQAVLAQIEPAGQPVPQPNGIDRTRGVGGLSARPSPGSDFALPYYWAGFQVY